MITLASILSLGFFLGMRHATDADHVVAVSTIISRERGIGQAVLRGVFWGVGHTLTLVAVGAAIIVFGLVIPEKLGLSLEFSVAVMLVLLGISNLRSFKTWLASAAEAGHGHPHSHDEINHTQSHDHDGSRISTIRPLIVGVVHGLAGSAAVALLVLPLIRNPWWGMLYLLIFGFGTIAGMMLITATIAAPIVFTARRSSGLYQRLGAVAGFGSLCFGAVLIYHIGFVQGLFLR